MPIEFCSNCNTLLSITEIDDSLKNICKQCGNISDNKNDILCSQIYKAQFKENNNSNRFLKFDITIPRTNKIICINKDCISHKKNNLNEIALYTEKSNQELRYICINCNSEWK